MNTYNSLVSSSNLHRVGIRNISDYSPFGVLLKERTVEGEFFRLGFNGMESDPELKGKGNSYDFNARMFDPRIGRWMTKDPHEVKYPNNGSYNFSLNSPLMYNDNDGKDAVVTITRDGDNTVITYSTTVYLTGTGVDQEYLNYIEQYSQQAYQDRTTTIDGKAYILKIDVNYINAEALYKSNPSQLPAIVQQYVSNNYNNGESIDSQAEGKEYGLAHGDNLVLTGQNLSANFAGPHESQAWINEVTSDKSVQVSPQYSSNVCAAQKEAYATIHEVFHLLGLSDRVITNADETKSNQIGFETDWMSSYSPAKADLMVTFSQQHVDNLVKGALQLNSEPQAYRNFVNWGESNEAVTIYNEQGPKNNLDQKVDSGVPKIK